MEICLPVWKYRAFIDSHLYDHTAITTLLLVTTEETRIEDLLARKVATGDIGATARTIRLAPNATTTPTNNAPPRAV